MRHRLLALLLSATACGDDSIGPRAGSPDAAMPDAATPDGSVDAAYVDQGPAGDFRGYAMGAAAALQRFYDSSTGLWSTTGWWNSANALTALVDYAIATGSNQYDAAIANTFDRNRSSNFLNDYYDDEGWWALAWIRAFDRTGDGRYLDMAKTIFRDMTGGWDTTCGGGVWWSKARTYKNAIPNELFLEVAIRLHTRTPGDGGSGSFLEWAQREWQWFDASGMINGDHLVNDGLDGNCRNNGGTTWTYNQGVLIGGLVDLSRATGDATLLDRASAIAEASMTRLVDGYGVLHEPCEPNCGGDGTQFKGIFMRHLAELQAATSSVAQRRFIAVNADWIWNADRNASDQLGLSWSGGFDAADASRQSSALDALVAAIPFSDPKPNLAAGKTGTANGSCTATETAGQAFDGNLATKWCSGSADGTYWLEVDLGAPAEVGRLIVRHAGAGGENAAWNTRDFSLQLDGATVATITGNTHPVTIHRFAPVMARRIHLQITAPQTATTVVAARIYELEIYAR